MSKPNDELPQYKIPVSKLLTNHSEYSFDELMDLFHLEILYVVWCTVWPSFCWRSHIFVDMISKIRQGLYEYTDQLTLEEKEILSAANDSVIKVTRISVVAIAISGIGIFLKGLNKQKIRKLSVPNIGWFPFAINSLPRYVIGCLCQAAMGINAVSIAAGTFLSVAVFMIHYNAHFKLLRTHLKRTFPRNVPLNITQREEYKSITIRRLRDCYLHHLAILRFHDGLLKFYGIKFLVFRVLIILMFCTLAFILVVVGITPHNLLVMISFASVELMFVLLYSSRGQNITDWNYEWREELYGVEWWQQPKEVQTNIKLMIMGTTEPLVLYGVFKIVFYSHEGLFAIGNESFSFFNMVRALK